MNQTPRLLSVLSDQPEEDQLNFDPYAKTLAEMIADPGADTPLTIGVFGGWGRGKTSLMRMVRRYLERTAGTDFVVYRNGSWGFRVVRSLEEDAEMR